jgi:PAT family beta-lactamase induction signal transducer AmpG
MVRVPGMAKPKTTRRRIALLSALYLVQGLPFGFQTGALPLYLREQGVSLATIGFSGALALPWALKFLWAPMVDRWGSRRFGRRRSWIIPLQILMVLGFVLAAGVDPETDLHVLMGLIFALNLFAATQDIAVDGWAVDLLGPRELGPGNAAQVIGYKLGMLFAGGVLVWMTLHIGWSGAFLAMAALVAVVVVVVLLTEEAPEAESMDRSRASLRAVLRTLWQAVRRPGNGWVLVTVATYKTGESLIDTMFKPFMMDAGFAVHELGAIMGTYGLGMSILGSLIGGGLAMRLPLIRALQLTAVIRLLPQLGQWGLALSAGAINRELAIGIILAENLAGGALTTVMFAAMMSWVDKRIGATHFTVLASIEVWGKAPASWLSGVMAEAWGYAPTFLVGVCMGAGFLIWVIPLSRWAPPMGDASGRSVG